METIRKSVGDIGIAAYLMMFGFKLIGRRSKNIYFDISAEQLPEFEKLSFDYLDSQRNKFHEFDANIMALKKMPEYLPSHAKMYINDIGIASYLRIQKQENNDGYKFTVIGKKDRNIYFELNGVTPKEFDKCIVDYLKSPYHEFDANIMALKKMPEYMPD